ncbi:MAG: hypothetical protein ABIO72_06085 [Patescibacteria group bacterium]
MRNRLSAALILWLTIALGATFFVLPSLGPTVFVSPDETANAVTAHQLVPDVGISPDYPWLHPRSFVSHGTRLQPVGFLGISLIMSVLVNLFGPWMLVCTTPLLALSVVIPLISFTRKWGKTAQVAAVVSWLTFPVVVLYANRGLFPNLPVVCVSVWAAWFLWKLETKRALILSGLLTGLALVIRPVEAVWVLPWIGYLFVERTKEHPLKERVKSAVTFLIPCLLMCLLGAFIGRNVYGAWFVAGYQLRDPVTQAISSGGTPEVLEQATKSWFETWPFGVHPRNVWFNVKSYLLFYLLPWFLIVVAAVVTAWKEKKSRPLIMLAGYTVVVLSAIYGEALYQDHVRLNNVSLANSFLRYLLPLSVIAVVSIAWLVSRIQMKLQRKGTYLSAVLIACIAAFGLWTAFVRDDEGLVQTRKELIKYIQIRHDAQALIPSDAVVASERSDKIFFPTWTHVVSPMPSKEQLHDLVTKTHAPLALYLRTLTPEQMEEWKSAGFLLTPVLPTGNETLYLATVL